MCLRKLKLLTYFSCKKGVVLSVRIFHTEIAGEIFLDAQKSRFFSGAFPTGLHSKETNWFVPRLQQRTDSQKLTADKSLLVSSTLGPQLPAAGDFSNPTSAHIMENRFGPFTSNGTAIGSAGHSALLSRTSLLHHSRTFFCLLSRKHKKIS